MIFYQCFENSWELQVQEGRLVAGVSSKLEAYLLATKELTRRITVFCNCIMQLPLETANHFEAWYQVLYSQIYLVQRCHHVMLNI